MWHSVQSKALLKLVTVTWDWWEPTPMKPVKVFPATSGGGAGLISLPWHVLHDEA
jgi:hypothetical protein